MMTTLLAAAGGIMLGGGLTAIWRRPRRDASGRFSRRGADWIIDLDALRSMLRRLGAILVYMMAGWVLAFAVMLWGAKG